MNKAEFAAIVDKLLDKAYAIGINDCQAGMNAVSEYKWLANTYREYLTSDITKGVAEIESLFDKANRYKNGGNVRLLTEHHHLAASLLEGIIPKLKQTNQFPE